MAFFCARKFSTRTFPKVKKFLVKSVEFYTSSSKGKTNWVFFATWKRLSRAGSKSHCANAQLFCWMSPNFKFKLLVTVTVG